MENISVPPDCMKCRHFFITWDASFPRGCRMFGVKSRRLPSYEVLAATGRNCPSFELSDKIRDE